MTKNNFFNNIELYSAYSYNKVMKKLLNIVFIIFLYLIFINNQEAHAYVNPGSGSYIFQAVIGGILAIAALFKKLFVSLFGLLGIKKAPEQDNEENE